MKCIEYYNNYNGHYFQNLAVRSPQKESQVSIILAVFVIKRLHFRVSLYREMQINLFGNKIK